jgi:predicted transcriptional regulator
VKCVTEFPTLSRGGGDVQVLDVSAVTDILGRWRAGTPKARIAREVGVDRKTVRKYVRAAESSGLAPGPPLSAEEWAGRIRTWFPEVVDTRLRQTTRTELDRYRDRIATLSRTMSLAAVHRVLREQHGLHASLASLRRYLRDEPL